MYFTINYIILKNSFIYNIKSRRFIPKVQLFKWPYPPASILYKSTYMYVHNGTYFIPKSEVFPEIQGGKGLRLTLKYDTGFKIPLKTD